jgi:hypothetical protein
MDAGVIKTGGDTAACVLLVMTVGALLIAKSTGSMLVSASGR